MKKNSTPSTDSTWTGMVPVDDTALAVTDTGGPGVPIVFTSRKFPTVPVDENVLFAIVKSLIVRPAYTCLPLTAKVSVGLIKIPSPTLRLRVRVFLI